MRFLLNVNNQPQAVDLDPQTPLLWVLRETLQLTGTKYGCGIAQCGACTVHLDGVAVRSCSLPMAAIDPGQKIRTIEALGTPTLHPLQQAWAQLNVSQCGYCQSGMLMTAAALLTETPDPSDAQIDAALTNLCRCGTYPRIRAAIHLAARLMREGQPVPPQ